MVEEYLAYLNTIHSFAIKENAKDTQGIVEDIAKLIKYKSYRRNEIVTIADELIHIEIFINLMKVRFGNEIQYKSNIDEECIKCYIPHYTIMQLVEDSYNNNNNNKFSIKENNRIIVLNVTKDNDKIYITVEYNGHLSKIGIAL